MIAAIEVPVRRGDWDRKIIQISSPSHRRKLIVIYNQFLSWHQHEATNKIMVPFEPTISPFVVTIMSLSSFQEAGAYGMSSKFYSVCMIHAQIPNMMVKKFSLQGV